MPAPVLPTSPARTTTQARPRLAAIDGLRGLCALSVFLFHGWLYTMDRPSAGSRESVLEYAAGELRIGLVAFFVLSGFLLYRPWLKAGLGDGPRPDIVSYARSRLARIGPAYYAALIGAIALLWGLAGTPGVRLPPEDQLPLFFVFLQNFENTTVVKLDPPMWSLAVEMTYYALLPVLGYMAWKLPRTRSAQAVVPLLLVVLGLVYNWSIAGEGLGQTYSKQLPAMAFYFGAGMLGALALHGRSFGKPSRSTLMIGGLGLVVLNCTLQAMHTHGTIDTGDAPLILRDLIAAVGFTMITVAVAAAPRAPVLASRPLVFLGAISYGFYLWHVPVILFMRGHDLLPMDPFLGSLVALVPSILVSWLSWIALEQPAIAWAARRNKQARHQRARLAAARSAIASSGA